MNTSVSLTEAAQLLVAHLQELSHPLTELVGCCQILSISTPSLPLHRADWKHIPGIVYCGTYGSRCTVSDLIPKGTSRPWQLL